MRLLNINTRENFKKNDVTFKGVRFENVSEKMQIAISDKVVRALQDGNNGMVVKKFADSSKNDLLFVGDKKYPNRFKMYLVSHDGFVSETRDGKKAFVPSLSSKPHSGERPISFSFKFFGEKQSMPAAINDKSRTLNIKINELGYESDIRRNFYKSVDSFLEKVNSLFRKNK